MSNNINKVEAAALAKKLYEWMSGLKSQSGEFLPADVCCDFAGMRHFINDMAEVISANTKLCTCDQLMPGLQALNGRLYLAEIHHAGPYKQPPFVFCPWCGGRITAEIKMHPDVIAAIAGMTEEELMEKFNSFDKYIADAEMTNPTGEDGE